MSDSILGLATETECNTVKAIASEPDYILATIPKLSHFDHSLKLFWKENLFT